MPKIPATAKSRVLPSFPLNATRKAPGEVCELSNASDHVGKRVVIIAEGLLRGRRGKITRVYTGALNGLREVLYDVETMIGKLGNQPGIVTGLNWYDFISTKDFL